MTTQHRALPSVDRFVTDDRINALIASYSREVVLDLVREQLAESREAISNGGTAPDFDDLVSATERRAASLWRSWPSPVINATGVVLHTNLGRAPLSADAIEAVRRTAATYSDLELNLETGRRGSRQAHISELICRLTGAEAALVVNNNASAVLLGLAALASGKEVIVSRGEAVEIGGGFRIPDVLRQSGATLIEVGTTNRTYVRDFEDAISAETGAILAVHASNFRVEGFAHSPELAELVELGDRFQSTGAARPGERMSAGHRRVWPRPRADAAGEYQGRRRSGLFSGDKLLGGPQSGIVVGKQETVEIVSRHPLARAVRIDKLNMAALAATLLHYIREEAVEKVPVWRMIALGREELEQRARGWQAAIGDRASVAEAPSTIGGGSLAGETLPSWTVSIDPRGIDGGAEALSSRLRSGDPAVLGRIEDERVILDPRTALPEQDEDLLRVVGRALAELGAA